MQQAADEAVSGLAEERQRGISKERKLMDRTHELSKLREQLQEAESSHQVRRVRAPDGFNDRRKGPSVVGLCGLFQPIAHGLKLVVKEPVSPSSTTSGTPSKDKCSMYLIDPMDASCIFYGLCAVKQ